MSSKTTTRKTGQAKAPSPFKDRIDRNSIGRLAAALQRAWPDFPADAFVRVASRGLAPLELKARIAHVADALDASLPSGFAPGARTIGRMLDARLEGVDPGGNARGNPGGDEFGGWELWPVTEWIARAGLADPERALALLGRITRHASAEFAVRPFIDAHREIAMAALSQWVHSDDEHLRRLASEGSRPRLPWATRLKATSDDLAWTLALLEPLADDDSEYVRRSVSNHLNDLCREDAALGLRIAEGWLRRAASIEPADCERAERLRWVVRRGLRSLVKDGHRSALRLLGHDPDAPLQAQAFRIDTPVVRLSEALRFTLTLACTDRKAHRVVLDYAIGFPRADGSFARKVFKWATLDFDAGGSRTLERSHLIRVVTTRTARAGRHGLEVQANGRVIAAGAFLLRIDAR